MAVAGGSLPRYIGQRLLLLVPMIWLVLTLVFLMLRVAPGDPVSAAVGGRLSEDELDRRRATLGLDRPHIAGNSMGGWIALRYAIDYPGALASLILLDNAGVNGAEESELQKQAANEDYNPLVLAGLEDADRLVAMVVHKPPHIPSRLKPVLYADALKYRDQLDAIFWVIAIEGRDHPLNDRLGEVKVPTLILWGRHDKLLDVSCVPVLEAGIAGSRSHIFEHMGHVPMIEDPKATADAMKDFLARLP